MLKANAPTQLTQIWAAGSGAGPVNAVPLTPYTGQPAGQAAYSTGFATVNVTPIGSGGIPPWGADFNGVMQNQTTAQIWEQAGYIYPYSSAFATNANIGGYPAGALLGSATSGFNGFWLSTADSNTTNPDSSGSANWLELRANGGVSSIALSGATVTPTENQLGAPMLLLTGTLTANCQLILPLRAGAKWTIQNNTTGSFTVTVGGSSGTAVTISQGASNLQEVTTDGTNYYVPSISGGPYLPLTGTAVAATKLATARTIAMTGQVTWSVLFDGSANVSAAGTIGAGQVTLANLANETGNTLLGNPTSSAAAPSAITLTNGLVFSGTALGMGAITPTTVTASGAISGTSFTGTAGSSITTGSTGQALTLSTTGASFGLIVKDTSGTAGIVFQAGNGSTTPNKMIRANGSNGNLEIVNSAYSGVVASISDTGYMTISQTLTCQTVAIQNQTQFSFTGFTSGTCFWQGAGGSGDNLLSMSRTGSSSYAMTWYGTINISSDEDLKHGFEPLVAQPMHEAFWGSYVRNGSDDGALEYGSTAQSIALFHPHHVRPSGIIKPDGTSELGVDFIRVAVEQGIWCGREIDHTIKPLLCELINRVAALEEARA